ncbi:MAG TPA: helix-turn-helix domain-containing protein [Brevundimonas sp.]|nr:helix-turn-helix domain-containing protein [Brevundimonas sp.]
MVDADLVFGWRTALLLTLSVQLAVLSAALWVQPLNRAANRILATFLMVVVGVMTPYTIGFAGFYDAWMWLTFAPLALPLFLAPLLYGYTHRLVLGRLPGRWLLHLAPGLIQLAYLACAFLLPLDAKMAWGDRVDGPWVGPAVAAGVAVGLVAYALAALRLLNDYRRRLADERSDDDRFAARWLARVLGAMALATVVWVAWQAWGLATAGPNYFGFFWLHLSFGVIGLYLGVEGWRHAGLGFAPLKAVEISSPAETDWTALGADVLERTRVAGWWREPELSLAVLARRLGTNTGRLSRAINLGLGVNFSTFINGLRAEGVADALSAGSGADLLELAFDMGFASKASFNRAFRARYGMAPSVWRRGVSNPDYLSPAAELRRAAP